ncbi:MAG TPA: CapA family protein [Polyangiaceae bacterium]|nr:CapA family protein [Polyangiaceae bacterium]
MIVFLGDIAVRDEQQAKAVTPLSVLHPVPFEFVVANLEGGLGGATDEAASQSRLFNHPAITEYLRQSRVRVVTLANNHAFDFGAPFARTLPLLDRIGTRAIGAGPNLAQASEPVVVSHSTGPVAFLGFGWRAIGCPQASAEAAGANPLEPDWVLECVRRTRRDLGPDVKLALFCHWNYELEVFPQPLHRELAHAAVHAGADLIVGCHSHCISGVEQVNGRWIVYGLGNWLISEDLRYPARADLELAFGWDPGTGAVRCDWYRYEPRALDVHWLGASHPDSCHRVKAATPFAGMSHADYRVWFRKNRRKTRLLPVFADIEARRTNLLKQRWVEVRHGLIGVLRSVKLKGTEPRG